MPKKEKCEGPECDVTTSEKDAPEYFEDLGGIRVMEVKGAGCLVRVGEAVTFAHGTRLVGVKGKRKLVAIEEEV